jgi:NADH dehydrogenase
MKILVTGGTGVIGVAALPQLLKAGHEIRLLSRHADQEVAQFPRGVEAFPADLAAPADLPAAVAGCGVVIHIAGIDAEQPPELTFEKINVEGTRHLCAAAAAAAPVPFLLFISSLGAERGASAYHRSKLAAEEVVHGYRGPWVILRPGAVYGPGDETISTLLKMVRSLPAVPVVNHGDQQFQPLWCDDFGRAIAAAVARPELAGQTLELAGPDVTTTNDVLERLGRITQRHPARVPVPAALAAAGTRAAEALGHLADRWARSAGLGLPINTARLQMLLEGNVIRPGRPNALIDTFGVVPTNLQDGLEWLADLLPEQTPGEGVGAVERSVYSAGIVGSRYTPAELLDVVCEHLSDLMPIEFAAEPGAPTAARDEGVTMTGSIPGRGHIQVRMIERAETSATFVTIQGHPLAGVLTFAAERESPGLRFLIETVTQPANVLDWVTLRTIGGAMQSQNWRSVVRRVVDASGGAAPEGVQKHHERMGEHELQTFNQRILELVAAQKRSHLEHAIEGKS